MYLYVQYNLIIHVWELNVYSSFICSLNVTKNITDDIHKLSLKLHSLLIMLTSLAPSPIAKVTALLLRFTKSTTMAFCRGVTRQHMTALQLHPSSSNTFSMSGFKAWIYNSRWHMYLLNILSSSYQYFEKLSWCKINWKYFFYWVLHPLQYISGWCLLVTEGMITLYFAVWLRYHTTGAFVYPTRVDYSGNTSTTYCFELPLICPALNKGDTDFKSLVWLGQESNLGPPRHKLNDLPLGYWVTVQGRQV